MTTQAAISVINNAATALAAGRAMRLRFDHASLVSQGISRADGGDLYISSVDDPQLPTHVLNPNTAATEVWFALQESVAPSGSNTNHILHWGALDWDRSENRILVRDLSKVDPINGAALPAVEARRRPFLWYDSFTHKKVSGSLVPYVNGDTPTFYRLSVHSWEVWDGVLRLAVTGSSPQAWIYNSQGVMGTYGTRHRVHAHCRVAGGNTPATGPLAAMQGSTNVLGYTAGPFNAYTAHRLQRHSPDLTLATVTGTDLSDAWFWAVVAHDDPGNLVSGEVNGQEIFSVSDSTHAHSFPGVYSETSGSGGGHVEFDELMVEDWDGVPWSDMSVSVTLPSLSLPCPGFPLEETGFFYVHESSWPAHFAVHRAQVNSKVAGGYRLVWTGIPPEDFYEIIAFHDSLGGGAQKFTWTPPDDVSGEFLVVPGSLRTEKSSHAGNHAVMELERTQK